MSLELVEWTDAVGGVGTWTAESELEARECVLVRSVGWVIGEHEDRITMVSHRYPDASCGDMTIPKVCIVSRRLIE